jgi:hypothetical protein
MNKKAQDQILDYLSNKFGSDTVFSGVEGNNYTLIHLEEKHNKKGLLETHCIVLYKANGFMYKCKGLPPMPLFLFSMISLCKVEEYLKDINAIKFYLKFKAPLNKTLLKRELPYRIDKY